MAQRHIDPHIRLWTTSGELCLWRCYRPSVARCSSPRSRWNWCARSRTCLPNTWQLVLGIFLLGVILFLPRGVGSLWIRDRHHEETCRPARSRPKGAGAVNPVLSARAGKTLWRGGRRRRLDARYRSRATREPDRRQRRRQNHLRQHGDGLYKPDSGAIALDGMDLAGRSPRRGPARHFALVPEFPQLFIELTACENLERRVSPARGPGAVVSCAGERARPARHGDRIAGAVWPADLPTGRSRNWPAACAS